MKRWIGIPLAIVLGDGAVKKCAEEKLTGGKTKELFGGRIRLQLLHNPGVALGALKKNPKLILVINSAMLGIAVGEYGHLLKTGGETAAKTGLALLIDRMQRGYVTDYFSVNAGERFQRLKKIVFNCSDFCVFAGILLYAFGRSDHS